MVKVKVTENTGVTILKIPEKTKFTIMPFYQMGRVYSNHRSKKAAQIKVRRLITDKIEFVIFDSKRKVVNLKDFLYD